MLKQKIHTTEDLISTMVQLKKEIKSFGVLGVSLLNFDLTKEISVSLLIDFLQEQKSFDNFMELNFYLEDNLGITVKLYTEKSFNNSKYDGRLLNEKHVIF